MHVYVREHIVSLYYRTTRWILMKLGMNEALRVPYMFYAILARSTQGRIQGRVKIGYRGGLLQKTSSDRNATATNRMHSNAL